MAGIVGRGATLEEAIASIEDAAIDALPIVVARGDDEVERAYEDVERRGVDAKVQEPSGSRAVAVTLVLILDYDVRKPKDAASFWRIGKALLERE